MDIYKAYETSEKLLKDGRWIELEFAGEVVCSFRVRSAAPDLNADLRKEMAEAAIDQLKTINAVTEAVADPKLENRLFSRAVVTAWKGVTGRDGKVLKFTAKNCEQVFNDLPLLAQRVKNEAYKWTHYRAVFTSET